MNPKKNDEIKCTASDPVEVLRWRLSSQVGDAEDLVRFLKGSLKGSIGFLKGIYRVP